MASNGGLTRRRGGGGGGNTNGDDEDISRVASPTPKAGGAYDNRGPETSYESSENGHKIAFDPRDINESAERNKQPKLTLMEEVLLLGLKDKQVRGIVISTSTGIQRVQMADFKTSGIPIILERQHLLRFKRLYRH
jgi:hypothetical protein